MKMLSTAALLRTVDVMEGRGTLEEVEPFLQPDVSEGLAVYRQARGVPVIDTLDKPQDDEQPASPADVATPDPAKEAATDGPTPEPAA